MIRIELYVKRKVKYEKTYILSRNIMDKDIDTYSEIIPYIVKRMAEQMKEKINVDITRGNFGAFGFIKNHEQKGVWYWYRIYRLYD